MNTANGGAALDTIVVETLPRPRGPARIARIASPAGIFSMSLIYLVSADFLEYAETFYVTVAGQLSPRRQ